MIPLLIGFLARLIGLGELSKKVKEFITKVQDKVDKAIDKAIAKIVQMVKKLFGKSPGEGQTISRRKRKSKLKTELGKKYPGSSKPKHISTVYYPKQIRTECWKGQ